MFKMKGERIPECGAIDDAESLSAEEYGRVMLKRLGAEYERFAGRALERGTPPEGSTVLEIGPGPGWVSVFVRRKRPDLSILAVDASADMVRAARANLAVEGAQERTSVVVGTAERLAEVAPGPFALVYSRDSLHHWNDPVAAFANIRTVLAEGGVLVLADERRDLGLFARILVGVLSRVMGPMGRVWRSSIAAAYTPQELLSFLTNAGFKDVEVRGGLIDLSAVARK